MKIRGFGSSGFGGNRFVDEEEADPRVGLVNLADVMLVFACGLMVALVAHYNVNLVGSEVQMEGESQEISQEDLDNLQDPNGAGPSLEELGSVYYDPTTGKMYLVEKVDEGVQDWSQEDSAYDSDENAGQ